MESQQVALVQRSFAQAARFGPHVAATFYSELFAVEPSLRALFKTDMIAQGDKLMKMLEQIVAGLSRPETITQPLRELAIRHVGYGVQPHHYEAVGIALFRTLKHELGSAFTPETRAAWIAAYALISNAMREAAYGPAASRSV